MIRRQRNWLTPTLVTVLVCLIYAGIVLVNNNFDPLAFALLGTRFTEGIPDGTEGYDGQFAYQIAMNPAGAAPFIDVPAYRYQRILYPLLARVLAFGQPGLIPWTLILVNIAAIGLGTWLTALILVKLRVNRWYALAYGLYGGQLLSLRTDVNEPLAQGLVQLAMWAWLTERRWLAIVGFGLAGLAKETALVFLGAYMLYCLVTVEWGWFIKLGLAWIPYGALQLFLLGWLGSLGLGSGGAGATSFSPIPLMGWLSIATVQWQAFVLISLLVVPMSILPAIAGVFLSGQALRQHTINPIVFALLLNSAVILFLPASTMREPVAMLRLTQGLAACILLFGALIRSRRLLNYSTLWIMTNILLVGGVPE